MRNELTDEEKDIIETRLLPHRGKILTEIQMRENGLKTEELLEPIPLLSPEYQLCSCKASQEVKKIQGRKRSNDGSKEKRNPKKFKRSKF
ncbi:unnamed protein product [Caenorhabditis nigoni]